MKRLLLIPVLALLMAGCSPAKIEGADGHRYRLVKPAVKMGDGSESIAEYERVGQPGVRYAMRLTPRGVKPMFWRLQ